MGQAHHLHVSNVALCVWLLHREAAAAAAAAAGGGPGSQAGEEEEGEKRDMRSHVASFGGKEKSVFCLCNNKKTTTFYEQNFELKKNSTRWTFSHKQTNKTKKISTPARSCRLAPSPQNRPDPRCRSA